MAGNPRGSRPPPDSPERPVLADIALTRSDLRAMPAPQPLIVNTLDQGTTALLYGKWGTAKTFIALDWAASVATGRRWQSRATEQHRVLYVAAEGVWGFRSRVDAWETGWSTTIGDDGFTMIPRPVNLMKPIDLVNLEAFIDWGATDSSSSTPSPGAWSAPKRTAPRTRAWWSTP
jgi:hypothetical protein